MMNDTRDDIHRQMLDKIGDAAADGTMQEHLFISLADDIKRLHDCDTGKRTVNVPWTSFSVNDGVFIDPTIHPDGPSVLPQPYHDNNRLLRSPYRITQSEWNMQRQAWERELRTKEQDIFFTHRRISRLYGNLNTHKSISRITAKHKSLVAEVNMTYTEYIRSFNQQKERVREDFCGRIKMQIARLHLYEKLRKQLVERMHRSGMPVEEFVIFESCSPYPGAGMSYGGFVVYYRGPRKGKRPIFDMRIDCLKKECIIKIWRAVRKDNHFFDGGRFFCELLFASTTVFRDQVQVPEITDSSPSSPPRPRAASNPL
jgi:hypothetical protein